MQPNDKGIPSDVQRMMELAERNGQLVVENARLRWELAQARMSAVDFANEAVMATRDLAVLHEMMQELGLAVRANRLALFRIDGESHRAIMIAGFGPELPGPNEVMAIDDTQAQHALVAWAGRKEFVKTPTAGIGFDSFWCVRDSDNRTVIAVLAVDDTGEPREFNDCEVEMMRSIVTLIRQILTA